MNVMPDISNLFVKLSSKLNHANSLWK